VTLIKINVPDDEDKILTAAGDVLEMAS